MRRSLAIVLVSAVAAVTGYTFYYYQNTRDAGAQQPPARAINVATAGSVAPSAPAMAATLPNVQLKNRDDKMQSLRSWPGKSMIVNFWATWCGPCRKEIPLLKEIAKKETDFQLVGVAIDYRDEVLKFADEIKIDYPILIGEQDGLAAAEAFGVESVGLPFTVFTDRRGRIVTIFMGELTHDKIDAILAGVQQVNRGELTPDAGRAAIADKLAKLHTKA